LFVIPVPDQVRDDGSGIQYFHCVLARGETLYEGSNLEPSAITKGFVRSLGTGKVVDES
jgi:hypothetical protein